MKFERIGIPQPFSNGSRRLHLPKKVISFLRQYRKKEFKTPKEAGTYLKEGLSRFITSYIETLHHIYYILRTSSSFLWMSAGISALDLPKTHRRVVEAEQPPAVSQ
jgi:hypothetical protein